MRELFAHRVISYKTAFGWQSNPRSTIYLLPYRDERLAAIVLFVTRRKTTIYTNPEQLCYACRPGISTLKLATETSLG